MEHPARRAPTVQSPEDLNAIRHSLEERILRYCEQSAPERPADAAAGGCPPDRLVLGPADMPTAVPIETVPVAASAETAPRIALGAPASRPLFPSQGTTCSQGDEPSLESLFEGEATSLAERLAQGEREHARALRRRAVCGVIACAVVLALAAAPLALSAMHRSGPSPLSAASDWLQGLLASTEGGPTTDAPSGDLPTGAGASSSGERADRAGEVVYRYVLGGGSNAECSVTETVQFGEDGLCRISTLEAAFSEGRAAETYLASIKRDYGSSFETGSVEGSCALVTVDVSSSALDREGYEDALRNSVRDLTIVKKS